MKEKVTEEIMIDLLTKRYNASHGNGERYVFAPQVRSAAGFDARRTIDFMTTDLWPSKGLETHGHEIKVSRSDWLHELEQPEKSEEFKRYCNRWWLVITDADMVRPGELPVDWGMMVRRGSGLVVKKQAPPLTPKPMPQTMVAAYLRSATRYAAQRAQRPLSLLENQFMSEYWADRDAGKEPSVEAQRVLTAIRDCRAVTQ